MEDIKQIQKGSDPNNLLFSYKKINL